MLTWRLAAGVIGVLAGTEPVTQGQSPGREAVVLAATYIRKNSDLREMQKDALVLDPRVADMTGKLTSARAGAETSAILRALDASRMGTKEREMACAEPEEKRCRMLGQVKGVVALSDARFDGEKATVDVHMWCESEGGSEPVASKHFIVDLERVDGTWRVKGDRPLRIS